MKFHFCFQKYIFWLGLTKHVILQVFLDSGKHKGLFGLAMVIFGWTAKYKPWLDKSLSDIFPNRWAKRLSSETKCKWKIIPHYYLENVGKELIFECNYDCKFLDTSHYPPFYKTVLSAWQEVNAAIQKEHQSIHNEFIWNNKHIVANNKSLYIKSWHEAGVTKIKDLVKDKSFLTYNKFLNIYKVKTIFLQYHALVGAVPNKWKKTVKRQSNNDEASNFNPPHKLLQKLSTKTAYNILISTQIELPTAQSKILNSDKVTKENLPLYYSMPFVVTTETKLSIFQYKIIHDILPTNSLLFKMKIIDTTKCPLCQDQIHDIRHMFVKCPFAITFWHHFHKWNTFDDDLKRSLAPTEI